MNGILFYLCPLPDTTARGLLFCVFTVISINSCNYVSYMIHDNNADYTIPAYLLH